MKFDATLLTYSLNDIAKTTEAVDQFFIVDLFLLKKRRFMAHHIELHDLEVDLFHLTVFLFFVRDIIQQILHLPDLSFQLELGRQAVRVFQDPIGQTKILGYIPVIIQVDRFSPAGEIVEFPSLLGLPDPLFDDFEIS